MLKHIYVQNIALIRQLELNFDDRLIVLTGETGAGKSLIVDSLSFILGAKADKTLVSHGSDKAIVEGLFSVNDAVCAALIENGYTCPDGELMIARSLTADGKSEIRINGRVSTLGVLKSITALLADIHGQHEHQSLLKASSHITFLDNFAEKELSAVKAAVAAKYRAVRELERKLSRFGGSDEERLRTVDLLRYQVREIDEAKISALEEQELEHRFRIVSNAEKLTHSLVEAMTLLNGRGEKLSDIAHAAGSLESLATYDERFGTLSERVRSSYLELDDCLEEVSRYLDENSVDEKEVDKISDRLDEYKRLKRKYGGNTESVLAFRNQSNRQLEDLSRSTEIIEELTNALDHATVQYYESAKTLHKLRREAAGKLKSLILSELGDLGMGGAEFEVVFAEFPSAQEITAKMRESGADTLEFYLSANKGEPPKPLDKVISGGEMSRFMLALKVIAAKSDSIETMVFDEIDTGISGKIGEAIATKLAALSRRHQVLCITHLPYIAAMADQHLRIHKDITDGKTATSVDVLSLNEMLEEISRLVGGSDISRHSRSHSGELKAWCDNYKNNI